MISDSPKGTPVLQVSEVVVAVEEVIVFNCHKDGVHSKPDITNHIFSLEGTVDADIEQDTWETNFTSINKTGRWSCQTKNNVGLGEQSQPIEVTVEGKRIQ